MQQPTYGALPEDVKEAAKGVIIDPTVPLGQVKNVATGELVPATKFITKIRAKRKRERQNRQAGRARR